MERIPDVIHQSWHEHLQPLFDNPKMNLLRDKILPHCRYYPKAEFIFRVFEMPLEEIKVVILGQDPYFNGTAIGYAFAVEEKTPTPKSLQVIFAELVKEVNDKNLPQTFVGKKEGKTLAHWREQGIFLLNTALTVEVGNAGSHVGYWQWFTRGVIKVISTKVQPIWMLWGAKAQGFKDYIFNYHKYKSEEGLIRSPLVNYGLEAPHPAARSEYTKVLFGGCNHFYLCNEILDSQSKQIINW